LYIELIFIHKIAFIIYKFEIIIEYWMKVKSGNEICYSKNQINITSPYKSLHYIQKKKHKTDRMNAVRMKINEIRYFYII
jgi:hypothetical protein